jgi:hypothetical protein
MWISAFPESEQHEYQSDDGQTHMAKPEARLCQEVVGPGLGRQRKTKDCGKKQHPLKIAGLPNRSVI